MVTNLNDSWPLSSTMASSHNSSFTIESNVTSLTNQTSVNMLIKSGIHDLSMISALPLGSGPFTSTTTTTTASPTTATMTLFPNMNDTFTSTSSYLTFNNNTEMFDDTPDHNMYIMPFIYQVIWSFIFGSMVFVAAGGNIVVIWIVMAHKRMRTVTNYFLVNLSLADIMVSTQNVIFNFIYMLNGDWPFGQFYCKVTNFIAIISVAASVFTLMAISIDRYIAIVHPLKPRMSRTATIVIIVVIWIASSILSFPNLICSTTLVETFKNGDSRVVCYLQWHDGRSTESRMEFIYNVIIMLFTYVIPILLMSYTYYWIGRELWGSKIIGEMNVKQVKSIKSKQKIVKMMLIVVIIFLVCWAPYHIYFLLAHHYPQINDSEYAQQSFLVIYCLAMSNSMYNPLVYCWMNSRFRQGFRNVFCCTCFRSKQLENTKSTRHHVAARYSCASEATGPSDMRVRFNGNGNITLQATSATDIAGATGSSSTSPLQSRTTLSREML